MRGANEEFRQKTPLTRRFAPPSPEGEGLRLSRAFSRREKVAEGRMRGANEEFRISNEELGIPSVLLNSSFEIRNSKFDVRQRRPSPGASRHPLPRERGCG